MEKVAKALGEAHGDLTTAWGLALKEGLPPEEQRTLVVALVGRAHQRIVDVYKALADADGELEGIAPVSEPEEERVAA